MYINERIARGLGIFDKFKVIKSVKFSSPRPPICIPLNKRGTVFTEKWPRNSCMYSCCEIGSIEQYWTQIFITIVKQYIQYIPLYKQALGGASSPYSISLRSFRRIVVSCAR